MLKFELLEISWVQYFHDQAVDSREYIKKNTDRIPAEIREQLLSIVTWAEEMEKSCNIWCDIVFKQTEREIETNMFLEEQIKELFATIKATKHANSVRTLREAATAIHFKIRDWKYEAELKRLQEQGVKVLPPSAPNVRHVDE